MRSLEINVRERSNGHHETLATLGTQDIEQRQTQIKYNTKACATLIPPKTGSESRWSWRISSSCSYNDFVGIKNTIKVFCIIFQFVWYVHVSLSYFCHWSLSSTWYHHTGNAKYLIKFKIMTFFTCCCTQTIHA